VPFTTTALVTGTSSRAEGTVDNLSMQGMLLRCDDIDFDVGEAVKIEIQLSGTTTHLSFELPGQVIRNETDYSAIRFHLTKADMDSLTHLRYMVGYALGDPDKVIEEFQDYIDDNPSNPPQEKI